VPFEKVLNLLCRHREVLRVVILKKVKVVLKLYETLPVFVNATESVADVYLGKLVSTVKLQLVLQLKKVLE
jgi:hypothetical protein